MFGYFGIDRVAGKFFTQHPIQTENGVHRRAQLMAHSGDEFVLVRLRLQQLGLGGFQLAVAFLHHRQLRAA